MNRDMEHHQLVTLMNRRARIEAENKRMAEIEQKYDPLFWVFVGVVFLLIMVC